MQESRLCVECGGPTIGRVCRTCHFDPPPEPVQIDRPDPNWDKASANAMQRFLSFWATPDARGDDTKPGRHRGRRATRPPSTSRSHRWTRVVGAVACVAVVGALLGGAMAMSGRSGERPAAPTKHLPITKPGGLAIPAAEPSPQVVEPTPDDSPPVTPTNPVRSVAARDSNPPRVPGEPAADSFSVSASSASGAAAVGGAVTTTLATAVTSGKAQSVSFSATGLPGGATATFSPSSVSSGGSSTLTLATSSGTPVGTYTITITGSDGSLTHTVSYALTVTSTVTATSNLTVTSPPVSCASPGQKLGNPGFENGTAPWTASSGIIGSSDGPPAHGGSNFAWLGGYGETHTDRLAQTLAIPSGCAATLSFWLYIDTEQSGGAASDTLRVQIANSGGTVLATLATYSNADMTSGYVKRTMDVRAYAGQTVQISFTAAEDSAGVTSFFIDDTALTAS